MNYINQILAHYKLNMKNYMDSIINLQYLGICKKDIKYCKNHHLKSQVINKLNNQQNWSLYIRNNLCHSFCIIQLCYLYIKIYYNLEHINCYSNKVSYHNSNIMFSLFLYKFYSLNNIKRIYRDFNLYSNDQGIC